MAFCLLSENTYMNSPEKDIHLNLKEAEKKKKKRKVL